MKNSANVSVPAQVGEGLLFKAQQLLLPMIGHRGQPPPAIQLDRAGGKSARDGNCLKRRLLRNRRRFLCC